MNALTDFLKRLPSGYCRGHYRGVQYGIQRRDFNGGKSTKVYAAELGGTDFISFNYYRTTTTDQLRPCEMPVQKVLDFVRECELLLPPDETRQ